MTDVLRSATGRDSIMKMLLSTCPVVSTSSTVGSGLPSPTGDTFDDNPNTLTTYLHQLAGCFESEINVIVKDHCYARPWNWKPENVYVKPVKKLFFSKPRSLLVTDKLKQDEEVNVEGDMTESVTPPYDLARTRHVMDEFQRLANFARPDENDDWEEKIEKILWTPIQNRIFTKVMRILSSERLARLVKANSLMEPIFRRTSVDTAARRFRETLASAGWDFRVAQWLHNLLFENLPQEYMAIYLDILQTLRLKIPQLIDKIIAIQPNLNAKSGSITWETLGPLLKRSWDPIASTLNASRPKKLPGNPILVIAPSGVGTSVSSRQHKWIAHLGALGMVVNVHTHMGLAANRMTMMACMEQLVQATRTKIQDVRSDYPGRPIILVGFNTGAALACQVAQMEHVTAVICLGFPFTTVEGKRGTPDDTLMDIRCPVMFVIGQNATLVRPDDLEDLREKMLVETSLVVIGTADDHLRISTAKKISEGITQSIVDRCILDEVGDFVGSILLQPHPLPLRSNPLINSDKSMKKESRKRKNSTSSSVESEPHSPSSKKTRPMTPITPNAVSGTPQKSSAGSLVRSGTINTQPTLLAISGANLNHASASKRKPRVISNQKVTLPDQLLSPRLSGQLNASNAGAGITLNIGTLASLAPIGPLRMATTSAGQTFPTTTKMSNVCRPSNVYSKMPKMMATNTSPQSSSKLKTVMTTSKNFSKTVTSSYKHINITDKGGEAKLVNVLTTAGNQVRVSASTAAAMQVKSVTNASGALSALLQSRRSPMGIVSGMPMGKGTSASSILLTPSVSTPNTHTIVSSSSTTTPKEPENNGASSSTNRTISTSNQPLDVSKMQSLPASQTSSSNTNYPLAVSSENVVMLADSLNNSRTASMLVPMSGQNTITILPLSSKMMMSQRSMKTVPKITVNNCNLQRVQKVNKPQSPTRKKINDDFDDDLGNILDIPIIFAKDGENLNAIEKAPPISQVPVMMDPYDKNIPKLSGTTKVVLISNKHDKIQHPITSLANTPMQALVRATGPLHHVNRAVLTSRLQNQSITSTNRIGTPTQTIPRLNHPTIKYTKIILAKRNSVPSNIHDDKNEQVVLTKNTSKMVSYEKNEHRYAQMLPRHQIKFQEIIQDDALEIEDAIKTNIIERKIPTVSEIDLTSPSKNGHDTESLNHADSNTEIDIVKTKVFLSDTNASSEIIEKQNENVKG
ncbi:KAT8 regulatory NSL complex subunit 3 isoform X1 [Neodiprion lecontei]|uniref:KAT8 regulatory NSL complex subunit 3 isoform X1 n=2 Tax=Neodiprion lecontei TaxID=441921 RepID=A0A6J0CD85_NEOLC|nr:KAT8 regulatory NSL complex subunit 3 isoform X1 [Neodiprion lecontei]